MARLSRALAVALACLVAILGLPGGALARLRGHHPHRSRHAPARAACAGAGLTPSAANLALVRAATLCLVNRERVRHGERALRANAMIAGAAQSHSASMASLGYFNHIGPRGQTPAARMLASGYLRGARNWRVGENIAWGTMWLASPRAIVATWMASPGHRANILDRAYRDTAIGIAPTLAYAISHGQRGAMYTEDFGARG